tara:strand:- start:637 stop:1092 length:456 start_codon:yes stop_codon:yes gene_type:complete
MRYGSWLAVVFTVAIMVVAMWARTAGVETTVSLTTSPAQATITAGRYDTLENPRGTDYQVPAGETLYIDRFLGLPQVAAGSNVYVEIGYGEDGVGDSAAAPTNAVAVSAFTWVSANGAPEVLEVYAPIPSAMYPYVYVSQAMAAHAWGRVR